MATRKPDGYWTKERCKESASEFKTRSAWNKNERGAYMVAYQNSWLDDCCSHMVGKVYRKKGHWTLKNCRKSASKFKTPNAWRNSEDGSAYVLAKKRGWLDKCCGHMEIRDTAPRGHWTKENCATEASTYKTRNAFREGAPGAYKVAVKEGWVDEWLPRAINKAGYWTKERCAAVALKYKTMEEFRLSPDSPALPAAVRKGWVRDICSHMVRGVTGFDAAKPGILYYVRIESDFGIAWKIGITNRTVAQRFSDEKCTVTVLREIHHEIGQEAKDAETEIVNRFAHTKYEGPQIMAYTSNTELFTRDVLGIDSEILAA